jgi:PAS domain S-box-containing protein
MISTKGLITKLTIRLELYINLIVVPLALYYGTIAGMFQGKKLLYVIYTAIISATLATLFGMSIRIWKLTGILNALNAGTEDYAKIKLDLLSYPTTESIVIVLRWVLGLMCQYAILQSSVGITWFETLPVFFILLLCIPINSIISYCTTEHLLSPVLMDDRIKGVHLPRDSYTLFSVSSRTTLIVISVLIIPLVTLGHFLFISHLQAISLSDLSLNVFIILALSLAAIFVTVHESNAGIQSGLRMTLATLEELEKGNLLVEPIPLLAKGEIGVISQSVNVLAHSLRNSEEMFSKAFRSSPVGIVIWRVLDGCFLNVNESFFKISGFSRDSVIGRTLEEIGLFDTISDYHRMVQTLQGQGQVRGFETELYTSTGEIRMVTISAEMIMLFDEQCMIATIEDVTEKKTLEKEILIIGERERQKIGQDLHDDLAPHLIGIEVMSELLKKKLQENSVPSTGEVEKIRSLIEQAIQKTRRLSRGLCPVFLADHGLESLLQEMASNINEVYGITCRFHYQRSILIDDISICTHIYYIVHEAIYNAIRHGKADRITIDLLYENNIVTLTTEDNGIGIQNHDDTQGMGLKIMNFRANMIGADLTISSNQDKGTKVTLSFKYDGHNETGIWK